MKNIIKLTIVTLFMASSSTAFSFGWKDVENSWKDGIKSAEDFFDSLGRDIENLKKEISKLTDDIDRIKINTPKVDWKNAQNAINLDSVKDSLDISKLSWKKLERLGENALKDTARNIADLAEDGKKILKHWGNEITKCSKNGRIGNLCQFEVCKLDTSIEWNNQDNVEYWKCELKKEQAKNAALRVEKQQKIDAVDAELSSKIENLRKKKETLGE
jgi:hypothetical protein